MVDTPIDPIRVPSINLSMEELDAMQAGIENGSLPKDFMDRHFDAVDRNVFGHDAKKDRKGNYQEQGLGSSKNQTKNSVEAYRKFCKSEPDFAENLKRMEAELKDSEARRAAENPYQSRRKRRGS